MNLKDIVLDIKEFDGSRKKSKIHGVIDEFGGV